MIKRNEGKSENDILQNEFTAYLITSIKRCKIAFLKKRDKIFQAELSSEDYFLDYVNFNEDRLMQDLPLIDIIDDNRIINVIKNAKEREILILQKRIFEEMSFSDIAEELDISYKTTTSSYYRFLERIRKAIGGDNN